VVTDILFPGRGWALSVLFNDELKQQFQTFFERKDTFTLGYVSCRTDPK